MNNIILLLLPVIALLPGYAPAAFGAAQAGAIPMDNPLAGYGLEWTGEIPWDRVVSIHDVDGTDWDERLRKAQDIAALHGGGVVFFPAGVYRFEDSVQLKDGVVLRGVAPEGAADAPSDTYQLATRFEFPGFEPVLSGEGSPHDSAFKAITQEDPATDSNCGLVHIAMNRVHIHLASGPDHQKGRNRFVVGCILRNAADIERRIPDPELGQHPWQRFPKWHQAAIGVYASENILIANNRLPKSGEDNFLMKDYVLKGRDGKPTTYEDGVLFDYDFRPGIIANHYCVGGGGGSMPIGTPEIYPWAFTKGIVIRDNYVYSTGRTAIAFCGDGVICSFNVIRFEPGIVRPSHTGFQLSSGSSTSDTRAVEMRGWRYTLEGNDYLVYRNLCSDKRYYINDGEGLMHEGHCNSAVLDSRVINNRGNAYISIYHTGGVDGLLIEGNHIQPDLKIASNIGAIYVVADRNKTPYPCTGVKIIDNTVGGTGIVIRGTPGEGNLVKGNRAVGDRATISNEAAAEIRDNTGFRLEP
jgi:hypothetical protein